MYFIKIYPKLSKKCKFEPIFKSGQVGFVTPFDYCALQHPYRLNLCKFYQTFTVFPNIWRITIFEIKTTSCNFFCLDLKIQNLKTLLVIVLEILKLQNQRLPKTNSSMYRICVPKVNVMKFTWKKLDITWRSFAR